MKTTELAILYYYIHKIYPQAKPFFVCEFYLSAVYIPERNMIIIIDKDNKSNEYKSQCLAENSACNKRDIIVYRLRSLNCQPLESYSFDYYVDKITESAIAQFIKYLYADFCVESKPLDALGSSVLSIYNNAIMDYNAYFTELCIEYGLHSKTGFIRKNTFYREEYIGVWFFSQGENFSITTEQNGKHICVHRRVYRESSRKALAEGSIAHANGVLSNISEDWMNYFSLLKKFYDENGHSNFPRRNEYEGVKLGNWISRQRTAYSNGKLNPEKIKLLESINFTWDRTADLNERWNYIYELFKEYVDTNGTVEIPQKTVYKNFNLGKWVAKQRQLYVHGKLLPERFSKLDSLGFRWEALRTSH